jgi:DNA-binding response OmpR family regulator
MQMYPEGQNILIVIDDRECRGGVAQVLAADGFSVTMVAEGLAALRAISVQHYALIIAATQLPGSLDGKTTVRQARSRQPWLKALYITDHAARSLLDTSDVIVAPFERHELIGCVFELLQRATVDPDDLMRRARTALGSL